MSAPDPSEAPAVVAPVVTPVYEPPLLELQPGMVFPEEVFEKFNTQHWCFGCTNCNCN